MISKGEKRNSSLDLLKIIGMFLIIAHHYYVHGGFGTVSVDISARDASFWNKSLCTDHGVVIFFALITGFYMIGSRNDGKKRLKKILQLVVEIYFYAIVIFAILAYKGLAAFFFQYAAGRFPDLVGKLVYHSIFAVLSFVPYINPLLNQLSQKEYRRLLLILFLCWSVVPTLTQLDKSWEFSNVDFFFVMYAFGGYYRLHIYGKKKYANVWNALVGMICFGIAIGSVALCIMWGLSGRISNFWWQHSI